MLPDGRQLVYDEHVLVLNGARLGARTIHDNIDVLLLHGMSPKGRASFPLRKHADLDVIRKELTRCFLHVGGGNNSDENHYLKSTPEVSTQVRILALDRPGYCDSSAPPFGYSYKRFAEDIHRLLQHIHRVPDEKPEGSPDSRQVQTQQERQLYVLGQSSGGPCALALAFFLHAFSLEEKSTIWHVVRGVALTSADAPYTHPDAPEDLLAALKTADLKTLEKVHQSSSSSSASLHAEPGGGIDLMELATKHRGKGGAAIAAGWVNDFTLERLLWGFSCESIDRLAIPVRVHVGEKDFDVITHSADFYAERLLAQATEGHVHVIAAEGHFYTRKPDTLGKIIGETIASSLDAKWRIK